MAYAQPKNTTHKDSGSSRTAEVSDVTIDLRNENRFPADGTVCMILDHDGSQAVNGRLADVSRCGFRATHCSQELAPGRVIRFHYEDRQSGERRSGWARVIWSRVHDSAIESGCFVVIAD